MNTRRTDNKWLGVNGRIRGSWRYISFKILRLQPHPGGKGRDSRSRRVRYWTTRSGYALAFKRLISNSLGEIRVLQSNLDITPTGTYAGIFSGHTGWGIFPANLLCNSMLVYIVNARA